MFSSNHDDYHIDARKIAIEEYGCDKVIWFDYGNNVGVLPDGVSIVSGDVCCVAAEKDGEEVILFIPESNPKEGFFAKWKFDYSFTEIIEKMESVGIVCPEFDKLDGVNGNSFLKLVDFPLYIGEENILDKLDFPAYFQYLCDNTYVDEEQPNACCFIVQINHEIKIYRFDYETREYSIL